MDARKLDWFIHEPATDNPKNLKLEILIHFVDKDGNRTRPSCNRILIPLQVQEIEQYESVMLPMWLSDFISSGFQRCEFLHRLVRDPKRVERLKELGSSDHHKLFECAYFPYIDCIENLNIQHISQYVVPTSHHELPPDLLPDVSDQSQTEDSKI